MLGVDVMFDEMTYKEMEYAMKVVMKAEGTRLAELREILLGDSGSLTLILVDSRKKQCGIISRVNQQPASSIPASTVKQSAE